MSSLLDPAFTTELEALRRRMTARARSGASGERAAPRRGGSAEFLEHRPYSPGDDLRRVDWLAFARTGEPVLKLFLAEEDAIVRLIVDASASLEMGTPSKLVTALRTAAAIGYMALASSERAQVFAAHDRVLGMREPMRGRGALARFLRELDGVVAAGPTALSHAIDGAVLRSSRPGMLVVISDFFDPGPVDAALSRAAAAGHDLALIQVLTPEEIDPPWEGDFALEDVESEDLVDVTLDDATLAAYRARLASLFESLRRTARKLRSTYVRVLTNEPLEAPVRRFVERAVD